ncbi:MAG: DUF922 domain-containing protein [Vicinamibacterales bacterium]
MRVGRLRRIGLVTAGAVVAAAAGCGAGRDAPAVPSPGPASAPSSRSASASAPPAAPAGIAWSRLRPLTWADFRGTPDPASEVAALTVYVISYDAQCASGVLSVRVSSTFLPDRSWVKPAVLERNEDGRRALDHEQTHFDLSEVHVRRIRKRLRELTDPCRASQQEFQDLVQPFIDEDARRQSAYDRETVHGLNAARQAEWDETVRRELASLNAWAR